MQKSRDLAIQLISAFLPISLFFAYAHFRKTPYSGLPFGGTWPFTSSKSFSTLPQFLGNRFFTCSAGISSSPK
jgi:hypothetical protein